jgi:predicted nucleotidyltransferase
MDTKIISTMIDRIVRDFDPLQIILFGSQARGDAHAHSDVDLLVVFSELTDKRKTTVDIRRSLADLPVCKDILVTTPEELSRQRNQVGSILRYAQREGKTLYGI